MRPLRVVVVDDEVETRAFLEAAFTAQGHLCACFSRASDAERHLGAHDADLAMVDVYLGAENGIELLQRLREIQPDLYPVVMTAHVSLETAARSVIEGAVDYVSKPIELASIEELCRRVSQLRADNSRPLVSQAESQNPRTAMVGRSSRMLEVYKAVGRVAVSNVPVLITGPSGAGKELVARAIHAHSQRAAQPFTPVNCGSLTETLLESELFGHEKGAFTGADRMHQGLVEATHGGTLFLDEISETALPFQVKLLRVLQEQKVRRVGSNSLVSVDVRIIAASNRNLQEQIRSGKFREDLFYRLSVVQISVPALEERREDIPLLIEYFLGQFNADNDHNVTIDAAAVERLQRQKWPGNVRELENAMSRLAIFAPTGRISLSDVDAQLLPEQPDVDGQLTAVMPPPDRLAELERQHILRILKETGGNRSEAARRLGIERKTLYKKAVRLGINLLEREEG